MKKTSFVFAFCFLLLTGAGCAFMGRAETSEIAYWDLSALRSEPIVSVPAEFRSFSDISGNGIRLVTRLADGRITLDGDNRFSAFPAGLIRRRLVELFPQASSETPLKISGTLNRFEVDQGRKCAVLGIDYALNYKGTRKVLRHNIEIRLADPAPAGAFAALEKCVIRSANLLGRESSEFVKQCERKNR